MKTLTKAITVIGAYAGYAVATTPTLPNLTVLFQPVTELLTYLPTLVDTLPNIFGSLFSLVVLIAIYGAVLTLITLPVVIIGLAISWISKMLGSAHMGKLGRK